MFKSIAAAAAASSCSVFQNIFTRRSFCSKPLIIPITTQYADRSNQVARQVWIENMDTIDVQRKGLLELHPSVFAAEPRIDIIHRNVHWQRMYKRVTRHWMKTRSEKQGGGRKPWPQKGMGRARQGSNRAPQFVHGGKPHGPRDPTSYYFMLPFYVRVAGLTATLSAKLHQDDLHIIDDLEIPTDDPEYIKSLVAERKWGPSVLFVNYEDIVPRNITIATDTIRYYNIMPSYGLNVHSMLKHNTLVITKTAIEHIQDRLLYNLNRLDQTKITKT